MGLFLTLMYLLSAILGYASALRRPMRAVSRPVPEDPIAARLLRALDQLWQSIFLCATWALSLAALGYAFWKYGTFPGSCIAVCFMIAYRVSRMLLLHKLPGPFHLKLILNAVITAHTQCLKNGDAAGASSMERLFQKVGLELYARKLVRAAARAPKYLDRGESLRLQTATADNYQRPGELQSVVQRDEEQPRLQ